ncbi:MAG: hypothetical protein ACI9P8_001965, partial [Bacteroidia bacterium]
GYFLNYSHPLSSPRSTLIFLTNGKALTLENANSHQGIEQIYAIEKDFGKRLQDYVHRNAHDHCVRGE